MLVFHPVSSVTAGPALRWCKDRARGTMMGMRGSKVRPAHLADQGRWLERVQVARGHWRLDEQAGAIRSAGWWESVTVTWSPTATPPRRSPLLHRALATALETIGPQAAELVAATAWRLLDRRHGTQAVVPSPRRRQLPGTARALPRPDRTP
jgi:hypothetical protein